MKPWKALAGFAATAAVLVAPASASADWNQPAGGANPINIDLEDSANGVSLASIGGVPHIAWDESGAIHVARLNEDGDEWEELAGASGTRRDR